MVLLTVRSAREYLAHTTDHARLEAPDRIKISNAICVASLLVRELLIVALALLKESQHDRKRKKSDAMQPACRYYAATG